MNARKGQTFVEWLVIIGIVGIILAVVLGVYNKHISGNMQVIDLKHKFNVAYVLSDDAKFEKVNVKAWKDWENSDSIQIICEDGKVIYTHLANVKLVNEHH